MKAPLSKPRIIDEAIKIVDEQGLDKFSMRKLAGALGVEAMSIYNHYANKQALLSAMVDRCLGKIVRPDAAMEWREEMRARARSMRATFLAHPWLPMLVVSRPNVGPNSLALVEATLACLCAGGFEIRQADHAWNAMDSLIYGFVLQELNFPFAPDEYADVAEEHADLLDADALPHLTQLAGLVMSRQYDGTHDFDVQFERVLTGLIPE